MFSKAVVDAFKKHPTPFYYYDLDLLNKTLAEVKKHGIDRGYHIHFALKANNHIKLLETIRSYGIGADCVSGGELSRALEAGFTPGQIAFAGVGKSD